MRKALGFAGSTAVALILAAAGLTFDATSLTYAGVILLAVVMAAWIVLWAHPDAIRRGDQALVTHRRKVIADARKMVAGFEQTGKVSFREFARQSPAFLAVRPHLTERYMEMFDSKATPLMIKGGIRDALLEGFISQVDRLERAWNLV